MKACRAVVAAVLAVAPHAVVSENPLGKVIELMDDLAAKVTREGEAEAKAYAEYIEWCDDASHNAQFAVEDGQKQQAKLEAKISELSSSAAVADGKIEDLSAAVASGETDLKNAGLIRDKEAADFAAGEQELVEAIETLGRAVAVLEREMAKNPAALAQVSTGDTDKTLAALSVVLDAASFNVADKQRLQSLLQAGDDEDAPGAPAAATYKSHSTGIFDVLEDMKEKAEGQLSDLRKAESNAKHNYELLRSSLEAQRDADNKDLAAQKQAKAEAEEGKASAEGDLDRTVKSLANSKDELAATRSSCMTVAADHEATVASRKEELKVIAEAKQVLTESSSGAVAQSYSLLQLRSASGMRMSSRADLANSEVVTVVRELARKHHSSALAQLASRIAAVAKFGAGGGADPFGKVKGLIQDMIEKLEREAGAEATEKAYCDEQMAKTQAKKEELQADVDKLTSKIDQDAAKSAQLKEEIRVLGGELAAIAKEQAEMDKIRQETHADYVVAKQDLEQGLTGVRKALRMLRDYYSNEAEAEAALVQQPPAPEKHSKAAGAGQSIIGILEVVESDFANGLAKEEQQESDAQRDYDRVSQENKITTATKEQDVKYKTQASKSLDSNVAELSSDREATSSELAAVLEYDARIKDRCIAKPESYEERQARRAAEIEGLKRALSVLSDETAFLQQRKRHRMRGAALTAQ